MDSLFTSPEFQMSLLLFVALGGYLIASRINQSAVIGLILVGLLVGPSMLGWITYTDFVRGLAHLGAVILLFVIGLEFNVKEILSLRNGVIAAVGVIVPWIGGYWLSIAFGYDMPSAIFIGTALHGNEYRNYRECSQRDGQTPDRGCKSDHWCCGH